MNQQGLRKSCVFIDYRLVDNLWTADDYVFLTWDHLLWSDIIWKVYSFLVISQNILGKVRRWRGFLWTVESRCVLLRLVRPP